MKYEHVLNMGYSLRDAQYLFWLITEKGMLLPLVKFQCDYKFFDTNSYFLAINELPMTNNLQKRLQEHLQTAMNILKMVNSSDGLSCKSILLHSSFLKSSFANKFTYVEFKNVEVKSKSVNQYHCLTYVIENDFEISKPKWVVAEGWYYTEKQWVNMWEKFEIDFADKYGKVPFFYQMSAYDIFEKICGVINELNFLLDIKEEHPNKTIIDSLIPNHVNERYRGELEHIFSYGKYIKEQVQWLSGYKELQEYLYPHYDNGIISHQHSRNWYDFVIKNFTQKNGMAMNRKSLQNAPTKQNNSQNNPPNPSQTVPETFPNVSVNVRVKVSNN